MDIAEKELSNIITPDKPREITPQLIIEVVYEHYHISVDQMISKDVYKRQGPVCVIISPVKQRALR